MNASLLSLVVIFAFVEVRSGVPNSIEKRSLDLAGVSYGYGVHGAPGYGVTLARANYGSPLAHLGIRHHLFKRSADPSEEEGFPADQLNKRSVGTIHTYSTFPVYGHNIHNFGIGHGFTVPHTLGHPLYKRSVPLYQPVLPVASYGTHTLHSYQGLNGLSLRHGLGLHQGLGHIYKRSVSLHHPAIPAYGYGHGIQTYQRLGHTVLYPVAGFHQGVGHHISKRSLAPIHPAIPVVTYGHALHTYHGPGPLTAPYGLAVHHGPGHSLYKRSLAVPVHVTPYTFQHTVLGYNHGIHGASGGLHGYTQGFAQGVVY